MLRSFVLVCFALQATHTGAGQAVTAPASGQSVVETSSVETSAGEGDGDSGDNSNGDGDVKDDRADQDKDDDGKDGQGAEGEDDDHGLAAKKAMFDTIMQAEHQSMKDNKGKFKADNKFHFNGFMVMGGVVGVLGYGVCLLVQGIMSNVSFLPLDRILLLGMGGEDVEGEGETANSYEQVQIGDEGGDEDEGDVELADIESAQDAGSDLDGGDLDGGSFDGGDLEGGDPEGSLDDGEGSIMDRGPQPGNLPGRRFS
jgi:hypothetical protein